MGFLDWLKSRRSSRALDEGQIDWEKHDARHHGGHFDPLTMTCSLRQKESKKDEEDDLSRGEVTSNSEMSRLDAEYMDAVRNGNMEKCAEMVRKAASQAMPNTKVVGEDGLPKVIYRGTIEKENIPKKSFEAGSGIFLSDNEDVVGQFTFEREYGELITSRYNEDTDEYEDIEGGPIESCFVNVSNPKTIGGKYAQIVTDDTSVQSKEIENAFLNGYDCLILENVKEGVDNPVLGTSYVVRNPSQIKSSDPITYDDNNDVIPLSKRFQMDNPDIRY